PACPPASSPLPLRPPSFLRPRPPPGPTLFPYTTLFRSLHRDRPERGCGVIERSGAEIDRSRRHAQHREQRGQPDRRLLGAHMPQLPPDSLRPTGGSRRVLQKVTFGLVGEIGRAHV